MRIPSARAMDRPGEARPPSFERKIGRLRINRDELNVPFPQPPRRFQRKRRLLIPLGRCPLLAPARIDRNNIAGFYLGIGAREVSRFDHAKGGLVDPHDDAAAHESLQCDRFHGGASRKKCRGAST